MDSAELTILGPDLKGGDRDEPVALFFQVSGAAPSIFGPDGITTCCWAAAILMRFCENVVG